MATPAFSPISVTYAVDNLTRVTTLATRVKIAASSAERRCGLLKTEFLPRGGGLWIAPCEAIHTIGMRWPIDVAFLDRERRVRKLVRALAPWRMAICFAAYSVLELPQGALGPTGTQIGDLLTFRAPEN